jgi:hypothetical protein
VAGGFTTDWRKAWSLEVEYQYDTNTGGSLAHFAEIGLRWNQGEHFSHSLGVGYTAARTAAHWLDNFVNSGVQPGVDGIGGVDYVFAEQRRRTWDLTLRSSVLFDRDRSLQIYLQPFYTYGTYRDPRWLATPDSYDLRPYDLGAEGGAVHDYDFAFGAVNLNVVYRWEYRPGSTVYLVWTHARNRYEEGAEHAKGSGWRPSFDGGYPFRTEPENTFLVKISYWFSV